jgi:hypothetical protein
MTSATGDADRIPIAGSFRMLDFGRNGMKRTRSSFEVRQAKAESRLSSEMPLIYFIQIGEDGPIKIGRTICFPESRLAALQTAVPYELRIVAVMADGTPSIEIELHGKFRRHHIRGEWFHPGADLVGFIRDKATPWCGPGTKISPACQLSAEQRAQEDQDKVFELLARIFS